MGLINGLTLGEDRCRGGIVCRWLWTEENCGLPAEVHFVLVPGRGRVTY